VQTDIAIIGTGFGGLGAAIRLKQEGIDDFVVLERSHDVGGTWRDNTYPGCACDVESHLYSFSFALEPGWRDRFSRQDEIWRYLQRCTREFGIEPHIRFGHEVLAAAWDEGLARWRIDTSRGPITARVLVMATGPLSETIVPDIPGLRMFEGRAFHSARWDHSFDLTGKRVAVIGTGASAIQFIPEIQPKVGRLFVFQRTPPWVVPRPDSPIPAWRRSLYRRVPLIQRLVRLFVYLYREWSVVLFRHPAAMRFFRRAAERHLKRSVPDSALRATLTPVYTIGCKRILLSNDYYPALTKPNVEVITTGVLAVRGSAIVDGSGVERPIDAIVFATGFRPTDPPLATRIRGRGSRTMAEVWQGSPKAHMGTTLAGFPNLFMLLGPNTGLGHNSVVYMIEAQIEHFIGALGDMRRRRIEAIEPTADAQERWVSALDRRMRGTVWVSGGCRSWYLDATGRNSTLWPDSSWSFYRRVSLFRPEEYQPVVADRRPADSVIGDRVVEPALAARLD
jgi:cation diffusion facilitator CzcD-associated flavoprotein CzcO